MTNTSPPVTQRVFTGLDDIAEAVGTKVGVSPWVDITQEDVQTFADVTRDHQWIHVDEERAAESQFGTTIAHGYYVQSLISYFMDSIYRIDGVSMLLNYGSNSVRYPAPTKVGTRIRGEIEFLSFEEQAKGHRLITKVTIVEDGGDKPVCVAEIVTLVVP